MNASTADVVVAASSENTLDWPAVAIATASMAFVVLVAVVGVLVLREFGRNRQAQAAIAREEAFKRLAERYDSFTASASSTQERQATEISEVRRRLGEIEELLRSVE